MGLFTNDIDMSQLHEILDNRDDKIIAKIDKAMDKEDAKLDHLLDSMGSLDNNLNTLSATVAANHVAAISDTQRIKAEITQEVAKDYASKIDLSNGLNSIRNTAKLVWAVVLATGGIFIFLASKDII